MGMLLKIDATIDVLTFHHSVLDVENRVPEGIHRALVTGVAVENAQKCMVISI